MIIDKYSSFIKELQGNKRISLLPPFCNIELNSPSERSLEHRRNNIFEQAKIELDEADLIYFKLSGISLCWSSKLSEGGSLLSGGFRLNGITDALSFSDDFWRGAASLPLGVEIPEHLQHYDKLNWFERSADGTGGAYGCFIREPGKFPPPIAFYYRGWYKKLEFSFEEYLTKMFESYEVTGWQFFYVDFPKEIKDLQIILENMRLATELLPKLFPERDWSYHINRYKTVSSHLKI